jgi:hypothetical protein
MPHCRIETVARDPGDKSNTATTPLKHEIVAGSIASWLLEFAARIVE